MDTRLRLVVLLSSKAVACKYTATLKVAGLGLDLYQFFSHAYLLLSTIISTPALQYQVERLRRAKGKSSLPRFLSTNDRLFDVFKM